MELEDKFMTKVIETALEADVIKEQKRYAAGAYDRELAQVQENRRQAYIRDADPLFFGYQRGENTEQEWLDAVQAVKDAHPYPEAD
jgi:hypothetical protein